MAMCINGSSRRRGTLNLALFSPWEKAGDEGKICSLDSLIWYERLNSRFGRGNDRFAPLKHRFKRCRHRFVSLRSHCSSLHHRFVALNDRCAASDNDGRDRHSRFGDCDRRFVRLNRSFPEPASNLLYLKVVD